ncbi:MAG TPA: NTP transferase domain-containing protein [Candidatus Limnocylindrales bacterium]
MTVAAVILAATPESALADADGLPSVRRIADAAWSGGATPIVVVADDRDALVAKALAGAAVTLAEPAPTAAGPAAQMARGIDVALAEIREATGALLWPARMTWVGPETVTSLIETHGTLPDAILVPRHDGAGGWPVLVPVSRADALRSAPADAGPEAVIDHLEASGVKRVEVDLGDPGTTHDRDTPRSELPPYVGPVDPPAGHVHEWGAAMADAPDDGPLEGPALAPYAPAGSSEPAG